MLPRVRDAAEVLPARVRELDARVGDERLRHARDLRRRGRARSCTAVAAPVDAAMLSSSSRLVSASWCFTAWNEPMGRPNAMRSLQYSSVVANRWSIAPTDSATHSAAASCSWRSMPSAAPPGVPTTADAVDLDAVEAHLAQRCAVRSKPDELLHDDARRVGGDEELDRAVGHRGGHEDPLRELRVDAPAP